MAQGQNLFLLAADNSPELLSLLRECPERASSQDEHGYSLVHAAASYNHLDLLRTLVREFNVDVNLKDEDDETPLFVVETVEAARLLIEELAADGLHRGSDGMTAAEKIEAEGDFPGAVAYLKAAMAAGHDRVKSPATAAVQNFNPPPEGIDIKLAAMDPAEDIAGEADTEFRRRIEELAQRDDFNSPSGQADLRKLVEDAIKDQDIGEERNVRSKRL